MRQVHGKGGEGGESEIEHQVEIRKMSITFLFLCWEVMILSSTSSG